MLLKTKGQAFIHEFFQCDSFPSHSLHFFDLPIAVRKRIYRYACYECSPHEMDGGSFCIQIRSYQTLFSLKGRGNPATRLRTRPEDIGEFETAASLLSTCHTIHDEMFEIVYSDNDLQVQQGGPSGFDVLYGLKPSDIDALTGLTVTLDINRAVTPNLCYLSSYGHAACSRHLSKLTTPQEINLQEWHDALCRVLPNLPREVFCLHLVCDLQSLPLGTARKIAHRLLAPLHNKLTLQVCSVKLGPAPNMELQSLAEEVANKTMGKSQPKGQFRLLDLPQELRVQILSYTDLVTENRQVEWRPHRGYQTASRASCANFQDCASNFCRRAHAAYSQSCQCWLPPSAIFLTCRTLCFDAEQVFFRKNRIIVRSAEGEYTIQSTPALLDISRYLRHVVPARALSQLRCLEIVFPPFAGAYLQASEPTYQDWLSIIDFVSDKLNCPQLMLRVCFAIPCIFHRHGTSDPASYRSLAEPGPSTNRRADEIFASYRRALLPLSVLHFNRLRSLSLDFTPSFWMSLDAICRRTDRHWEATAASVKVEIEKQIMGEHCSGMSIAQPESQWRLDFECHE